MKLKAILFDLDGTLVDSELFHFECWNEILRESEVCLTYSDWLKDYAGIPLARNASTLTEKYALTMPLQELIHRRETLSIQRMNDLEVPLMYYAREILDFFKQIPITMALVTGSNRDEVNSLFKKNGLRPYFDTIVTNDDVKQPKPNPECYNLCLKQLGLEKEECLVFEDTVNGLKAAKAAGLTCYAIQRHEQQHAALHQADRLFLDFEEVKSYLLAHQLV
ncbi:HAD superfamily hydrolase (TIGR01509 family) [Pedobacter sp. CAN_A7]|uniref:HAD family hydrolase n=1 Tax=Pedobacter sp. CAN_A7 TaxID=2787722 RepID=UPI0018CAA81E